MGNGNITDAREYCYNIYITNGGVNCSTIFPLGLIVVTQHQSFGTWQTAISDKIYLISDNIF